MASTKKKTSYSLELSEEEFNLLMMALDNIACDEDTYGDAHSNACHTLWRSLGA